MIQRLSVPSLIITLSLGGCADFVVTSEQRTSQATQALESAPEQPVFKEMRFPNTGPVDMPATTVPADEAVTEPAHERAATKPSDRIMCPLDLPKRDDWEPIEMAKQEDEAESQAEVAARNVPEPPPVPAAYLAKQERFFALAKGKQVEWASLSAEDAERAYDELKQRLLGE